MTSIEERLAVLSRLPGDVVSLVAPDGSVIYISPSVERTLGYSVDDYLKLQMLDLVHPDDYADTAERWRRVVDSPPGEPEQWEFRMRHADGSWQWIEVIASNSVPDPDIGAIFTNFRNVTDRHEAEAALRASEARFRAVIQNSRDVTGLLSETGNIVWVSPGVTDMLGWTVEELIDSNVFDLLHPDDLATGFDQFVQGLTIDAAIDPVPLRLRHADGRWLPVEVAGTSWRDGEKLEGVVINVRDITWRVDADETRRQSEERFKALVQESHDAIVVMGADANITYATPSVEQMFGRPLTDLGTGLEWVHPDELDYATQELARVMTVPGSRATMHARVQHADGRYLWIEAVAVNLLENEAVAGVVINIRDVTDRHLGQEALQASEQRLRSLVHFSGSAVEILDEFGFVRWCSPSSTEVLGMEPDELLGRWAGDFVHPDDIDDTVAVFLAAGADPDKSYTQVSRIQKADGSWIWLECTFTNRLDDPTINGVVGNFRDINEQRGAEQALRLSERLFRSLARSSPSGIFQQNAFGECIYVNRRWQEITGYTDEEALGHGWRRIIHADDRDRLAIQPVETLAQPAVFPMSEFRVVRPDGETRWVAVQTAPMYDDEGIFVGNVGAVEDITERLEAQRDSKRLTDIFEATADLVAIADVKGTLLYLNASAREFFGLTPESSLDDFDMFTRLPAELVDQLTAEIEPTLDRGDSWSGELPLTRADGTVVPHLAQVLTHADRDGGPEFYSAILHDISERKAFEHRLAHQATHDPLTGLPNRTLLLDRLGMALARARRHSRRLGVLFLDLDHFKVVNDSLGHGLGDRLLVAIAERLQTALRPGDTIARFGGDEFVVLCEDLIAQQDVITIADRINDSLTSPFVVDEAEVFVGVSIGIAFPDDPDADPETLIRDADAAMYQAKERGRSRWVVFDNAMRAHAVDRLDIENALRRAVDRRELRVFYQPIVRLDTGAIEGVEALLRWEHPERGLLHPGDFIAVAEETGLIVPIGAWVLDQACRQVQRWQASMPGLEDLVLSVNLSGRQLGHGSLVDDVSTVLTDTGIDPTRVELEITESVLMDDVEMSEDTLGRLRRLGVKLVVDDFGTGYSSLSYLRRFPVDQLKVDRSFVAGLGSDPGDSAIVTAIVTLAHTLGLEAVAEGVESHEQLVELRNLGCDKAQGFHIARPAAGSVIGELLSQGQHW